VRLAGRTNYSWRQFLFIQRVQAEFDEFKLALTVRLAEHVEQAWLFGSWGTPDFGHDSDIDVMLVVNTD